MKIKILILLIIISCLGINTDAQNFPPVNTSADTVIEHAPPLILRKKIYYTEKRGLARQLLLGATLGYNLDILQEKENLNYEKPKNGQLVLFSSSYFLNFFKFSAGIGYREINRNIHFQYKEYYPEKVTYAKIDSQVVAIEILPDRIVYEYSYDTTWLERTDMKEELKLLSARQNLSLLQIPLEVGIPIYIKRICVIPAFGSILNIPIRNKISFYGATFNTSKYRSKILISPSASCTALYPIYKKIYVVMKFAYTTNVNQSKKMTFYKRDLTIFCGLKLSIN